MNDAVFIKKSLKTALRGFFNPSFHSFLLVSLLAFFSSCEKEESPPDPILVPLENRVLIACEGSLGNGNSALTLFEPDSNRTTEDVYKQVNGMPLGDVFQSITRIRDAYFLCINNSDRITVINREDYRQLGTISIPKPRYILQVSPTKAYVSTLFSKKVYVIDPTTLSVRGSFDMPFKNPEGMCLVGNRAFVCTWDSACSVVYSLDTATDAIVNSFPLAGKAPQELLLDKEGMLWVMGGNQADGVQSTFTRINPTTGQQTDAYYFGKEDPVHPVLNSAGDSLYFIQVKYTPGSTQSGIYRMNIHDKALPATAFIAASGLQNYWGLDIHPKTGDVYVADPMGFTQRGRVMVYHSDGSLSNSFQTGVGPGHFMFD